MQNITIGRKPLYKIWHYIHKISKRQVDKRKQVELRFDRIIFPTAFTAIIRYEIADTRRKFELVMQGNFTEHYRKTSNGEEADITAFDLENIIKVAHLTNEAYEITL